ncbi:glycosyltransferase [Ilumatobacter sp.]|uniref:glycosyltransferase n=1 Tax=Ilumatobacter sp. TaxID=1967498 RepID=UPI003C5D7D91
MTSPPARTRLRYVVLAARAGAGAVAIARLAGAARTAPPVTPGDPLTPDDTTTGSISVVIPARDEADRIGPLLDAIIDAPGVDEVIVVDDQSSDATASIAVAAGATVVDGTPLPDGWAGKAWALQQGLEAAGSEWVLTLDADARPDPRLPSAMVRRAVGDSIDFLTVGGRFECPTRATRWLHASMLTTLVYRFGPPGTVNRPERAMANGQCMLVRRADFLAIGGMSPVSGEVVEDIALARRLATRGWSVGFLDAADLLTVRMFESLTDTWTGWGRSLSLPGVESRSRQLFDLAVVVLAQAAPLPRLILRRSDLLDIGLLAIRVGTLVGTRTAYDRVDVAYWLSPLADSASAASIGRGIARRGRQTWRGRRYP